MKPETLSDEQLCAFVDGRLDPAAAERVARQLEADPALAAQLAELSAGFDATRIDARLTHLEQTLSAVLALMNQLVASPAETAPDEVAK
ncbi:MAG: hypothetical protein KDE64_01385 [Rhodocyclaceae bacterium]|nr:hypothetical protein [Rhodocyclaceae bacterium]